MHTYSKHRGDPNVWTVGHYQISTESEGSAFQMWVPMKDFGTEYEAAAYVNYLNGGDGKIPFSDLKEKAR